MDFKEIQDLIKLVGKNELSEFKMKDGEFEISIRTKNFSKSANVTQINPPMTAVMPTASAPVQAPAPAEQAPASNTAASQKPAEKADVPDANLIEIKSPIVGTFYRSSGPDKDPFVKVGDSLNVGDVVCIVEAMKLFNEIESEIAGKVVKVMIEDASPVEYDQVLFLVDPKG